MHAVENEVAIIDAFEEVRAKSIREFAGIVQVSKATVHRTLHTLNNANL